MQLESSICKTNSCETFLYKLLQYFLLYLKKLPTLKNGKENVGISVGKRDTHFFNFLDVLAFT